MSIGDETDGVRKNLFDALTDLVLTRFALVGEALEHVGNAVRHAALGEVGIDLFAEVLLKLQNLGEDFLCVAELLVGGGSGSRVGGLERIDGLTEADAALDQAVVGGFVGAVKVAQEFVVLEERRAGDGVVRGVRVELRFAVEGCEGFHNGKVSENRRTRLIVVAVVGHDGNDRDEHKKTEGHFTLRR